MIERSVETKTCSKCSEDKLLDNFSRNKSIKSGRVAECKDCYNSRYKKSKSELIARIYRNQKNSSKQRGHAPPNYTKEVLVAWVKQKELFHKLHKDWVLSDYDSELIPSIDRLDDYLPYTLDNIQITTWRENREKCLSDRKSGRNNKTNKPVVCYDLEGNKVSEYHSAEAAARSVGGLGSNIRHVCSGKKVRKGVCVDGTTRYSIPKVAYGFVWEWLNEE